MRSLSVGVAVLTAIVGGSSCANAQRTTTHLLFGIGTVSCSAWLSNHSDEEEGKVWILGFWSGMNTMSLDNRQVGVLTDGPGVVGEVKKACAARPSSTLHDAAVAAYIAVQKFEEGQKRP